MILSTEQILWLQSRGGRTEKDVEQDEKGLYCWFYRPPTPLEPLDREKIYLPKY